MSNPTRAEICVTACADAWRDSGEILLSPTGLVPIVGARLARATHSPGALLTDGEALLAAGVWPVGERPRLIEGWMPYRAIFDFAWTGKRHVMMMPSQIDRFGNANISFIGDDYNRPKVQLLGVRGAPGNTVNHPTSYWVPKHSPRSFVAKVDMVSGVGYDTAAAAGPEAERYHDIHRVVSDLGVFDFGGKDHSMRLISVHPGVTVDEVVVATGFELEHDGEVPQTRIPTDEELQFIRGVIDPGESRNREVSG